jgi:hypothetical protein
VKTFRIFSALALGGVLAACQDGPMEAVVPVEAPYRMPVGQDVRTGWIYGPDGEPVAVRYTNLDGWATYQGDIRLGRTDEIATTREELTRRSGPTYGVFVDGSSKRWPSGVVPYVISTSFSFSQQQTILAAMSHIAGNNPGVKFVARNGQTDYIVLAPHTSVCDSYVGKQGGAQTINLATGCLYTTRPVIHEVLHALGLWHEQSRCDRDSYVTINSANIETGAESNFDKMCTNATDVFAYDEASIMHYDDYDFSGNGQPTITSKRGLAYLMGSATGMSQEDVKTIHYLYAPPGPGTTTVTNENGYPRITWSAVSGATHYTVEFKATYEENDYERGYSSYEWGGDVTTYTTSTTVLDSTQPYTGVSWCQGYSGPYGSSETTYRYIVKAHFPGGFVGWGGNYAPVATC